MMEEVADEMDAAGSRQRRPGRDLHVDFHEGDDEIRVVADLTDVTEDAIEVESNGEVLTIRAASGTRTYRERIDLPVAVDETTATATYDNGVLEVAFQTDADDGTVIEVE